MVKAFICGKFAPYHLGHRALIEFGLRHCDFLSVLVCVSNREQISGRLRVSWLEADYADSSKVEVQLFHYKEEELANSSVASLSIAAQWAKVFGDLYAGYQLIISSEPYGEMVAQLMGIHYLYFDIHREVFPISASQIVKNRFEYWNYLPKAVKRYYAVKVVILGTESTGKSTLCAKLAKYFDSTLVEEVGRELIEDSQDFTLQDLYTIAFQHALNINQACIGDNGLIIIDTDVHITLSYAQFMFQQELSLPASIFRNNQADLYLYLDNKVPFIQDGTRLNYTQRNALDEMHRKVLKEKNILFEELQGTYSDRFEQAVDLIQDLLIRKQKIVRRI